MSSREILEQFVKLVEERQNASRERQATKPMTTAVDTRWSIAMQELRTFHLRYSDDLCAAIKELLATSPANEPPEATAISHLIGTAAITRLDDSAECVGCGNTKRYRGKSAESLICCRGCWNRLPKWVRDSYIHQKMRPIGDATHGPTVWQNRISLILKWMRETSLEN